MSSPASHPFALSGEYCGFIRTLRGKKRMVLRTEEDDHFLKVPKELRRHLFATLARGAKIAVHGEEVHDEPERGPKLVVSKVERLTETGTAIPVCCPIRVCAKKNCWRSGGKELWNALQESIDRRGLKGVVQLEAVHCLDHCKRAPNAECQGCAFHRCSPADAEKILDAVSQHESTREAGGDRKHSRG